MASPRASTRSQPSSRGPAAREPGAPPPLSTARRLGVLVVVGALAGSVMMAVGSTGNRPVAPPATPAPSPSASPTPSPSPSPVVPPPQVAPVIGPLPSGPSTDREIALPVMIPDPGVPLRTLELRVYRGNRKQPVATTRVRELTMTVDGVPLRNGENQLTVAIANAGGEGPRSEPVLVVVDSEAPAVDIREPDDGAVINGITATVRGITEPGVTATIANRTSGASVQALADERGVFIGELRLGPDENRVIVSVVDGAGNRREVSRTVIRGDSAASARLTLSRRMLRLNQLPQSVNIRLELFDPNGAAVEGATVTFSIIPPGLAAQVFTTTTTNGVARWDDVLLAREGAQRGNGWVTAEAQLPGGLTAATATTPFEFR